MNTCIYIAPVKQKSSEARNNTAADGDVDVLIGYSMWTCVLSTLYHRYLF